MFADFEDMGTVMFEYLLEMLDSYNTQISAILNQF